MVSLLLGVAASGVQRTCFPGEIGGENQRSRQACDGLTNAGRRSPGRTHRVAEDAHLAARQAHACPWSSLGER